MLNKVFFHIIFSLFLLGLAIPAWAQKTIVFGTVIDSKTNQPIPFANIAFQNSKIGTTTDFNGKYKLETYYPTDSLVASFVGYNKASLRVKKDISQELNFKLNESSVNLGEVVIKGSKKDENPAHVIFKRIIANKPANNREKLEAYDYEAYNKIEFDINNISEEFQNRKIMKPFRFVFNYVDSNTNEKPYLPFFITESLSNYYYRKTPKSTKEIIKATKVSGLENESVSQFLGDMYQNVNIYDNYIGAFGKNFMSPIADFGLVSYDYYLVDSATIDNNWCYKIIFQPKRKYELTFTGHFWVHDTTYAIKQVEAEMSGDANINFIKKFWVNQTYSQVENEVWMLTKDQLIIDFNLAEKQMGFYGRKTSSYRNFTINQPKADEFYKGLAPVIVENNADNQPDTFWQSARHDTLSAHEVQIYNMIDTLKELPVFKTYVDIFSAIFTGYYIKGPVEIGPYSTLFSFNPVEGARVRIGGRTSNSFSTRVMPEGYIAYGFTDKQIKYSLGGQYFLTKKPRLLLKAYYTKDIEQLGLNEEAWGSTSFFAALFRRVPQNKLSGFNEAKVSLEREWFTGFSSTLKMRHKNYLSVGPNGLNFTTTGNDGTPTYIPAITTTELAFATRFAYKEKLLSGEFERVSLGTNWPIFDAELILGIRGVLGSEYNYQRLSLKISDQINLKSLGKTNVNFVAGKIWGQLPYPLLKVHPGNQTYYHEKYAFNLMNFFEFVSDEYVNLFVEHHFNGLFLNKAPFLRRMQFREVVTFKMAAGTMRQNQTQLIDYPENLFELTKPYFEAQVGLENIFKFVRVDAIWRFNYLNNPNVTPFGIRAEFEFGF